MSPHMSGPLIVNGETVSEGGGAGVIGSRPGRTFYLNAGHGPTFGVASQIPKGSDSNDGLSWDRPFLTLSKFLSGVRTFDRLYFVGDVREEGLVCSNLAFDVQIIGCGGKHHADNPDSTNGAYHRGAASIRPPASPTAATNLLEVRGRGWEFHNIHFDIPVDAAAVALNRNALSDTSEYDASHARFYNCRFGDGLIAIKNVGGCGYVKVIGCDFLGIAGSGGAAIKCTSTAVAVPLYWEIAASNFHNNASHILSSMSYSTIRDNIFGRFTATLAIDIDDQPSANQGEYNVITRNYLSGTYGATAYPPGSNNEWGGNYNSLSGGVTADDPA